MCVVTKKTRVKLFMFTPSRHVEGWTKGLAPFIINLSTRWRSVVTLTPGRFAAGGGGETPVYIVYETVDFRAGLDVSEKREVSC